MVIEQEDGEIWRLAESHSIMRYLSQISKKDKVKNMYPENLRKRSEIDQRLDWIHTNLRLGTNRLVFFTLFTKLRGVKISSDN